MRRVGDDLPRGLGAAVGTATALDDALRRSSASAVTAAVGLLVTVPLAGVGTFAASGLLGICAAPAWWTATGLVLLVAVGTVGRAYAELETAGLVTSRRGAGTRVAAGARRPAPDLRQALDAHAEAFVRAARLLAADDEQVRAALERSLTARRASPR